MLESAIQARIIADLKRAGWFVTKLIQTSTNGIPDLLVIRDGRVVFIEVKQPGKKPTEIQKYRMAQIVEQGIEARVAHKSEDINDLTQ